jgi:hypothetical protein
MDWLVPLCALVLRLSQAKTLSELAAGACRTERVNLSQIGRRIAGGFADKHRIKRVWRFTANDGVEPTAVMKPVIARLLRRRKGGPLPVALDWTEIAGHHTLMAAAVIRGRCVPLLWGSYDTATFHRSQNALEEALLLLLRDAVPRTIQIILVADRGFGRTEFGRFCQAHDLHYAVRTRPDVWVRSERFRGKLLDYPVKKGMCRRLRDVEFRKENPVKQHVVIRWKKGLPKDRDEPWFLMTDLDRLPLELTDLYAARTRVEEFFRDAKSRRTGWSLRNCRLSRPERVDRLLLVLALAYILLTGLGELCKRKYPPGTWCNTNDPNQCSRFFIGLRMWDRARFPPARLFAAVAELSEIEAANWG